ncbi:hypothetical protein [Brachybacterium kimchii]|uniref:Uncharacterized protein n=1 Tax=Brachybacterium kimchii TaxID=2942909 RepID=A0ABY4N9Z8_9MICO|nr:hypothetical protein [Brachybacterium kimchii]UQN30622.1 hypothetical protein M4486_04775 [Brachybacterium kimchii]
MTRPHLPVPGPVPDEVKEETFTKVLGRYLSATRRQADQRDLRLLVTKSLVASTNSPSTLTGRWVDSDSWHWDLRPRLAPDVVATDQADVLALVMEGKGTHTKVNATGAATVRRAISLSDARLAREGQVRDARSVKITDAAVPTDPAWDVPHAFADCRAAQDQCALHTGSDTAGVHQGDVYTSVISYLPDEVKIPDGGLEDVDFIALLPTAASARKWGTDLVSADRWHVASVHDFLERIDDGRTSLPSDQEAWLNHLLDIAWRLYPRARLTQLPEIERAYSEACEA